MTISDEQYEAALKTIKAYREERGIDFYVPINVHTTDETISLAEFRRYLELTNSVK